MRISRITVDNLASFVGFSNDAEFKGTNLIFGTNGAGKSTLASLFRFVDNYKRKGGLEAEDELKEFFRNRISKEAGAKEIAVEVVFDKGSETIKYNLDGDRITCSNTHWTPVRVFDEEYTFRTIGQTIRVDLKSGIVIGEANIELDKAKIAWQSLTEEREAHIREIDGAVSRTEQEYRESTDSHANVDEVISRDTVLSQTCLYAEKPQALSQRKRLGYGKPPVGVSKLDVQQDRLRLDPGKFEEKCLQIEQAPYVRPDIEKVLKDYVEFFKAGVVMYGSGGNQVCPFCRRTWPEADSAVEQYRAYLESTYNKKRENIAALKKSLSDYKQQVTDQCSIVESRRKQAASDASKYQVDMSAWKPLDYDQTTHDLACSLLDEKLQNMEKIVSIKPTLEALQLSHENCIEGNNVLIGKIQDEIDAITSRRKVLNKELSEHYAAHIWKACSKERKAIATIDAKLAELSEKIERIEAENPPSDTIRAVFNQLIEFMGLSEYYIDENRQLKIRIDKDYDISREGQRISSAQKKLLSLCYFFAETVSEAKNISDLKNFVLVFDDPVDSADYVFFYGIANVIENADLVISKILNKKNVKLGQIFVLTHNSLLFDRLSTRWKELSRTLHKDGSKSALAPAEKSINNYSEYIREICKYYENPGGQKRRMIYVGNLIRRVLEILSSFDSLGSNDIQDLLNGMGKTKLALLANHLSHESFTKVLNPISSPMELQDACGDLLSVIKQRHPSQFDTIVIKHGVSIKEE